MGGRPATRSRRAERPPPAKRPAACPASRALRFAFARTSSGGSFAMRERSSSLTSDSSPSFPSSRLISLSCSPRKYSRWLRSMRFFTFALILRWRLASSVSPSIAASTASSLSRPSSTPRRACLRSGFIGNEFAIRSQSSCGFSARSAWARTSGGIFFTPSA